MNGVLYLIGAVAGLFTGAWVCFLSNIIAHAHMTCCWKCIGIGCLVTAFAVIACWNVFRECREFALSAPVAMLMPFVFQSLFIILL